MASAMGKERPNKEGSDAPWVTGEIVIDVGVPTFDGGTAHVRIEDVSHVDAPAVVLVETTLVDVAHFPWLGATRIPFALPAPTGAPTSPRLGDYSVRVWIDTDGDGKQGPRDLYSDQSYPVFTRGFGRAVVIFLRSRRD